MQRDDHITMNIPIQIYARIIAFAMHECVCTFWCWCWLKAQHKSDAIKMQNFSEKNNNLQYTKYSIMKCEHTFQIIVTWCAHPFCLYILKFQSNQTENSFETLYPSLQQFHWKVFIDSMRLFEMKRCDMTKAMHACFPIKMLKWGHTRVMQAMNYTGIYLQHSHCKREKKKKMIIKTLINFFQMQLIFCCSSSSSSSCHSNCKPFMNYDFISVDRLICRCWSFACCNRHFSSLLLWMDCL